MREREREREKRREEREAIPGGACLHFLLGV
jgi:hypothetical protein